MPRILDILIGFKVDPQKNQQAISEIDKLDQRLEKLDETASNVYATFDSLEGTATGFAAAGAAVLAPLILSAQKYVDVVGNAEAESREWAATTQRLEKAQVDLGRKATNALNPYRNALADILTKISQVDPAIIRAGVEIGGVVALIGGAGLLAAQVGKLYASSIELVAGIQKLQMMGGLTGRAANAAVYGGVGVAAVGLGVVGGVNAVRGYGKATGDERLANYDYSDALDTAKQAIVVFATLVLDAGKTVVETLINLDTLWQLASNRLREAVDDKVISEIQKKGLDILKAFEMAQINVEEGTGKIASGFERAYLSFLKSIGELKIETKLGDIDIGKELGVNLDEVNDKLEKLGNQTADFESRRQSLDEKYASKFADIDSRVASYADTALDIGERREALLDEVGTVFEGAKQSIITPLAETLGLLEDTSEKQKEVATGFAALTDEQKQGLLDSFDQLQTDLADAETAFNDQRKKELADFNEETAKIEDNWQRQRERQTTEFERGRAEREKEFNRQRQQAAQDFARQQKDAVVDFNHEQDKAAKDFEKSRAKTLRDNQKEDLKRIEDFQRERERREQDHRLRLLEAVGRLDATAVLQELRGFQQEDTRAGEDFNRETQDRQQQLDQQLAEEKAAFEEEQRLRRQQFQEQQAEEVQRFQESQARELERYQLQEQRSKEAFERQQALAQEDFDRSQAERRQQFNERRAEDRREFLKSQADRRQAFITQYNELMGFQNRETQARRQHYQQLERDLQSFLRVQGVRTGSTRPTAGRNTRATIQQFAEGGYLPDGIARTHAGEFALNQRTTQLLENMAGGKLTQQSVQNMVTNNNRPMSITAPITINGAGQNPDAIAGAVRRELVTILEGYTGG
jgi:hypothetical protein